MFGQIVGTTTFYSRGNSGIEVKYKIKSFFGRQWYFHVKQSDVEHDCMQPGKTFYEIANSSQKLHVWSQVTSRMMMMCFVT